MLERENFELKSENRKIKQVLDSSSRSSKSPPVDKVTNFIQNTSHNNNQEGNNVEKKKELMIKLLKTHKLLQRYVSMKKNDPYDSQLKKKLSDKIPQFEHAIKKLKMRKEEFKFYSEYSVENNTVIDRNFTMVLNSTVNDNCYGFKPGGEKSMNNTTCNESFNKSVKSLLNSMKTDNLSRRSDQNYLKELKQNTLAENEKLFQEKIEAIEALLKQLKE